MVDMEVKVRQDEVVEVIGAGHLALAFGPSGSVMTRFADASIAAWHRPTSRKRSYLAIRSLSSAIVGLLVLDRSRLDVRPGAPHRAGHKSQASWICRVSGEHVGREPRIEQHADVELLRRLACASALSSSRDSALSVRFRRSRIAADDSDMRNAPSGYRINRLKSAFLARSPMCLST